ncbi:MAG: hypothetical protein ACI8Z1_003182 [Candidatus Azotimanducaceae bacterium]|jgi:hypothetical protein
MARVGWSSLVGLPFTTANLDFGAKMSSKHGSYSQSYETDDDEIEDSPPLERMQNLLWLLSALPVAKVLGTVVCEVISSPILEIVEETTSTDVAVFVISFIEYFVKREHASS